MVIDSDISVPVLSCATVGLILKLHWYTLGFSDFSGQSEVRSRAPVCGGRAHLAHSGQSLCFLHTFSLAEANAVLLLTAMSVRT